MHCVRSAPPRELGMHFARAANTRATSQKLCLRLYEDTLRISDGGLRNVGKELQTAYFRVT